MNRNIILIALLCLLSIGRTVAQSVTVEAKIDSLQILIGEQAKVQLQVAMDAKQRAVFPAYTDTLVRGVEIIETAKPDTQFLNDRQRMLITQEYIVTSFDSALYYLPPMPVTVDGKEYSSKALALKVYSMPVDIIASRPVLRTENGDESAFRMGRLVWADRLLIPCIAFTRLIDLSDHSYT